MSSGLFNTLFVPQKTGYDGRVQQVQQVQQVQGVQRVERVQRVHRGVVDFHL
jgi:hypothetical protein